jgi:ABC-2 type transport system ATP-binding protein
MNVIELTALTKTYGTFDAVQNVSLQVNEGDTYAILGLNGAGKTTTIRMILDMVKPTSGTVLLFGKRVHSGDPFFNQIGYMVENAAAYPNLTVVENLRIYFNYRRLKDDRLIEETIHNLQLYNYRNVPAKNLSLGNKQRLGLAKALFHKPRLLILDEPTNGLDPAGIVQIRSMLQTLATDGVTIFISSHLLGEVIKLATRIGIVHEGKMKTELETRDLNSKIRQSLIIKARDLESTLEMLTRHDFRFTLEQDHIYSSDPTIISKREQIAAMVISGGFGLSEMYVENEGLESYFLRQIV